MRDVAASGVCRAQAGIEDGRVPGEMVASAGVQGDPRALASGRAWRRGGQAARALTTTHAGEGMGGRDDGVRGRFGVLRGGAADERV